MSMHFIIIDNQNAVIVNLQELLAHLGHQRSNIWPDGLEAFRNWSSVTDKLLKIQSKGFDPKASCCVLFLDLALDVHSEQFHEGIAEVKRYAQTNLAPYVLLVHTKWPTAAQALQ